jgi:hypothetical protein
MSALRLAAVPVLAGMLAVNAAPVAAADEPAPTPAPTPTPTPSASDPTAIAVPEATPIPPVTGTNVYITTTTTTTTIVNAPITVVAAPITTKTNNSTSGGTDGQAAGQRIVMDLTGCGEGDRPSQLATSHRVRRAQVRLAPNATLIIRVNGKRVTSLRLPSPASRRARGVALRLSLARDGMLTIRRPSGLVAAVQACVPA